MDLSKLRVNHDSSSVMQVLHPETNKPLDGMTITVKAYSNPSVQQLVRSQETRRSMRRGRNNEIIERTEAEKEANGLELILALVEDWTGFEIGDKKMRFTQENATKVFSDKGWGWLGVDVIHHSTQTGNYLPRDEAGDQSVGEPSRVATHEA